MKPQIISVEGIAGAGKTTLVDEIQKIAGNRVLVIEEFPVDLAEGYLSRLSIEKPDFPLSNIFKTPISQTFMLAANAAYKIEKAQQSCDTGLIVMDRCHASVLAYQSVILEQQGLSYLACRMREVLQNILIPPDITFYLKCDQEMLRRRLLSRNGNIFPEGYFEFLQHVDEKYEEILKGFGRVVNLDGLEPIKNNALKILEEVSSLSNGNLDFTVSSGLGNSFPDNRPSI